MAWAIFSNSHLRAIGEMLTSGSERALAVVGGALLEDTLYRTLSERLRNNPEIIERILGTNGPLGNMGAQIDVLYLLYGIDQDTRIALKAITTIRNLFAHEVAASFNSEDKKFVKAIDQLNLHEGKTHYPHHLGGGDGPHKIETIHNQRDRFTVNLKLGLIALMRDRVSHKPHSSEQT
jgi:hypothetical protein